MSHRFRLIVFALIYLFSHICAASVYAADPQTGATVPDQNSVLTDKIAEAEKRLEKRIETYSDAQIPKVVDSRFNAAEIRFEKQSELHFSTMKKLFDETKESFRWLLITAGGLLSVMAAIAAFLFVNQGKNIRDMADKRLDDAKQQIAKSEQEISRMKQELENKIKEVEKLKSDLDSALKPLLAYKDKKIVWAYESVGMNDAYEIDEIRKNGFQVAVCQPGDEQALSPDKCDLMIYSFCKSGRSVERLKEIIKFLKSVGRDIPLIIYTYAEGISPPLRLDIELPVLNDYKYNWVMANMPLTLKSYFNSLIRF